MTTIYGKTFLIISLMSLLALAWSQNFGDGEVPSVLSYNSPLRKPDSLRSRPYFDFLSTLYRHDTEKNSLFQPYLQRNRREAVAAVAPIVPVAKKERTRRAIVFRPLFVYRQQQIKKQQYQAERKRRV